MQHPYNYDGKETLLHPVATIGAEMNQQTNIIFPQLVTSSIASSLDTSKSVESFPHPLAYVPSSSASFLRRETADSLEAPSFVTNIAPNTANITSLSSEIPSDCFYHGSNSISSLSSMTAKEYRKVPHTIIPFEKKDIRRHAERFEDTEYTRVLFPALVVCMDRNERVETLMTAMLDNRKFVKNMAQKIYEEEINTRCSYMNISGEEEKLRMLDSAKAIFKYYEVRHGTDWKSMMIETSPIFLSPAILNKTWISKVRSKAEFTLQCTIVKDLKYDAERSYDFVHTISQKHVKDLRTKL